MPSCVEGASLVLLVIAPWRLLTQGMPLTLAACPAVLVDCFCGRPLPVIMTVVTRALSQPCAEDVQ